ncbi:cell wall hydrolase [Embleya sp. NPDC020630]|uniref:cell wall hydrolase n=1 Tax=Embleya sp. NPDC020630 TaxID=3363979 RepID=UPI0037A81946
MSDAAALDGCSSVGDLPVRFRDVAYVYARHPEAVAAGDLGGGANCQLYAYAFLGHYGLYVPPLRSSELWAEEVTRRVVEFAPLDLLLFDGGPRPDRAPGYGAHVGVFLGHGRVLHLCREVGRPAIWGFADFAARPAYARLLGAKRCRAGRGGSGHSGG